MLRALSVLPCCTSALRCSVSLFPCSGGDPDEPLRTSGTSTKKGGSGGTTNRESCGVWSGWISGTSFSYTLSQPMQLVLKVTDARSTVATTMMYVSFGSGGGGSMAALADGALAVGAAPPEAFEVGVPYPNPATQAATVRYGVAATAAVRVAVYDVLGRAVQVRDEGTVEAGWHETALDVSSWPAGVYVVRVEAGPDSRAARLVVR